MSRLILHSDDFGLHAEVNRGILEAATNGVLTSASLLVNGLAVDDAIEGLHLCPQLGVGLHLNILRGRPLSNPEDVPSLVNGDGKFVNSIEKLLVRSLLGRISRDEVLKEYRAQLQYLLERGVTPTHFDGEKHTHILFPEAVWAVQKLTRESGIKKVRMVNETALIERLNNLGIKTDAKLSQRLKLRLLEWRSAHARSAWRGISGPSLFYGVSMSGGAGYTQAASVLEAILSMEGKNIVEWMFHVGYSFDSTEREFKDLYGNFFLNDSRYEELQFLISPSSVEIIGQHREHLITYRDI